MVPNVRSMFVRFTESSVFWPLLMAFAHFLTRTFSSMVFSSSKLYTAFGSKVTFWSLPANGLFRIALKSTLPWCGSCTLSVWTRRSVRPTISLTVRNPSLDMYSLNSCAIKRMKFSTYSGLPLNLLRSSGFCVATPTGQVSRLHTRIITHPMVTSGAVAKPNSSAPINAAIATSRPLISLPSVSMRTRFLRPFLSSVWCVSASPSSHGSPALWIELLGAAPVPPS